MLTLEDCLGLCDLDEEEIKAIAEHQQIPEIVALEMAEYLVHLPDGDMVIKRMILEDIEHARDHQNSAHAELLEGVLRHFIATHPKLKSLGT